VYRVRWENAKLDATVSEGIGYGMLLAVSFGEQQVFDGLLAYYQLALNQGSNDPNYPQPATGLMHWLRYGCDAHWDTIYSEYPDNAAADADLDVAMALIMADCRWGGSGYAAEASRVIGAIRQYMFMDHNGMHVLQPGDSSWYDSMGAGCVNYSYFAPAYYREFAAYDSGNAQFWNDAADDVYSLLAAASNSSTGLVRNWGSADGGDATPECHDAYTRAASYGDDAARAPWRIATDYIWNGTAAAKSWTDRVTTWVDGVGITNTAQWYELGGNVDTQAPTPDDHTAINVGPWAVGAMTYDQATVDAFAAELVAIPAGSGDHDGEYFPRMLKALSLIALTGSFTTCGGL
jgi:endo-1,4-beta-D-glucanase Y